MYRTVLLSTLAAAMVVGGVAVHASPAPVDAGRVAVTQLTFHLEHGRTVALELRAGALSGGNTLRIIEKRCRAGSCDANTTAYQTPLGTSALTIDPQNAVAQLNTTIDGHSLQLRWRPDGTNTAEVGGFEAQGGDTDATGSTYEGSPARTSVTLDGRVCSGSGAVGDGAFVASPLASSDTMTLSDLHLPATAPFTCG